MADTRDPNQEPQRTARRPIQLLDLPGFTKMAFAAGVMVLSLFVKEPVTINFGWSRPTPEAAAPLSGAQASDPRPCPPQEEWSFAHYIRLADHPAGPADVYLTFDHLDAGERARAEARWVKVAPDLVRADGGAFTLSCRGPMAAWYEMVTADYAYGIAPGRKTPCDQAEAYRVVHARSAFRVPVVRGDWLYQAAVRHAPPSFSDLPDASAVAGEYLDRPLPAEAFAACLDADARPRFGEVSGATHITRRELERDDGTGSLFVRWATAAELGVPVR